MHLCGMRMKGLHHGDRSCRRHWLMTHKVSCLVCSCLCCSCHPQTDRCYCYTACLVTLHLRRVESRGMHGYGHAACRGTAAAPSAGRRQQPTVSHQRHATKRQHGRRQACDREVGSGAGCRPVNYKIVKACRQHSRKRRTKSGRRQATTPAKSMPGQKTTMRRRTSVARPPFGGE